MRSEEIAIRSGDLKEPALTDVQRQARDYVVSNGIRTGHEYGVAIADGKVIREFTNNLESRLRFPGFGEFASGSIEVHHNHPVGDSFSSSDFAILLSRSEIGSIFVHGHSGFFAVASRVGENMLPIDAENMIRGSKSKANLLLSNALKVGVVSMEDAQSGLWQVVSALLLESFGLIRYTVNSEMLLQIAKKVISRG